MSRKRFILLSSVAAALIGGAALSYWGYTSYKESKRIETIHSTFNHAKKLLQDGDPDSALYLLNAHRPHQLPEGLQDAWPETSLKAALEGKDFPQVENLLQLHPKLMDKDEDAALWWCRAAMHRGEVREWRPIANRWKQKTRRPGQWKLLEVDELLLKDQKAQARELLQQEQYSGREEVNRQLRLAMTDSDPKAAWDAYSKAYQADIRAPDTRSMAASFLEGQGLISEARREYIAAYLLEPQNPLYGNLLGDFYMRANAKPQAIETWREAYETTKDPRLWWKVWFWEKMTRPRGEPLEPSESVWWGTITKDLANVDESVFLGPEFLEKYPQAPAILSPQESYHWAWTLDALQRRDEEEAITRLREAPYDPTPFAKDLRPALNALLEWRVYKTWPTDRPIHALATTHRYLRIFEKYVAAGDPDDPKTLDPFEQFLASDWAFGALFLAAGWLNAADLLLPGPFPESFANDPRLDWMAFAYIKMKAALYDDETALEIVKNYPNDPAIQGLAAELLLRTGDVEGAIAGFEALLGDPSPAGYRAAYLRAYAALERMNFDKFDEILANREDLNASISGKELTARAAIARDNETLATQIYTELDTQSIEGLVFRFNQAKEAGAKEEASRLVDQLIAAAPNEPAFHNWRDSLSDASNH